MMPVTKEEVPIETGIFSDIFKFLLKYQNADTVDEWKQVVDAAKVINNKYESKNKQLCLDILLAVINDIERKYKKRNSFS